jgi:hypothetical protein
VIPLKVSDTEASAVIQNGLGVLKGLNLYQMSRSENERKQDARRPSVSPTTELRPVF